MAESKLKKYRAKRDFTKTKEPRGTIKKSKKPIFVIQQHAARAMHYDFRLEIDGVLVSWAVPKGPSLNPRIKRLAVMTEDHPIGYASFEGTIPEGEYGAGPVIIWDKGTYKDIKENKNGKIIPMATCLKEGSIEIFLQGKKLQGAFALVRLKNDPAKKNWLLIKMKDEYADGRRNITKSEPESIKSGKTIKELAAAHKKKKK